MAGRAAPQPAPEVGRLPWSAVRDYLHERWIFTDTGHHSVIAQTGAGKTHLIRHGILPLVPFDRVLVIDSKGGADPSWQGWGKVVKELPDRLRLKLADDDKPFSHWYRLVVPWDMDDGRRVVRSALEQIARQGRWVVVADELRNLTDPQKPNLNVRPHFEQLMLRGRSNGVAVVAGTQAPRWVPSSFYDQASFAWFGQVRDTVAHKRLLEVGGMTRELLPTVATIKRHTWLLNADGGDYLALCKPPARGGAQ